jgi:hypothetical protein
MNGHFMRLCRKCGAVVAQCRCFSFDKSIEYVEDCDVCRNWNKQPIVQPTQMDIPFWQKPAVEKL